MSNFYENSYIRKLINSDLLPDFLEQEYEIKMGQVKFNGNIARIGLFDQTIYLNMEFFESITFNCSRFKHEMKITPEHISINVITKINNDVMELVNKLLEN